MAEPSAKRTASGGTFASCFSLPNLLHAYRECSKGGTWKWKTQAFEARALTECRRLQAQLLDGTYRLSPAARFTVMERGKPRDVKSVDFRDRVVQRCLCDRILIPAIEESMSPSSSAVLKGRGLSVAYESVRGMVARCPPEGWVLQYDFASFFASVDHGLLLDAVEGVVSDPGALWLLRMVVESEARGLELGSHVSQLLAAWYPTPLDRAMEGLSLGYHRYMDDGVATFPDKASALAGMRALEDAARGLKLELSPRKTHINRVTTPFVFCKMRFTRTRAGCKVSVTKRQSRRTVRHLNDTFRKSQAAGFDFGPVVASCAGGLARGDADLTRLIEPFRSKGE